VSREPQGLALDDQVMADAGSLVPQTVPCVRVSPEEIRADRVVRHPVQPGHERVEAPVQLRDSVEQLPEPFPRSPEGLGLRLANVPLDGGDAVGSAPVPPARGANQVVPSQLHGRPSLARW
jgi:hypothetical protein